MNLFKKSVNKSNQNNLLLMNKEDRDKLLLKELNESMLMLEGVLDTDKIDIIELFENAQIKLADNLNQKQGENHD